MKNIFLFFLIVSALGVYAQKGIVNNGARIVVESGAYIKVQGDNTTGYTNKSFGSKHGRIDLDGEIVVYGFFTNNATANTVFINLDGTGVVSFEGESAQSINGTQPIIFEGLNLSGANVTMNTDVGLTGALNFGSGLLNVNSNMLSFGASATVAGIPGTSSMLIPGTTGVVRKYYASTGSFTYPIGDVSGSAVYLPVVSNISSGTFGSGAYLDLQMVNSKHPQNTNTTDFISRYWDMSEYNISGFNAALSFTYATSDISGTEGNLSTLGYDGTFWDVYNPATTATNKLTATASEFYQFTGGGADAVTPQISWASDGLIEENMENGEVIRVEVVNDQLVSTLNVAQWNVSGLPSGVSVGSIVRAAVDTAIITLSGNRLDDYDSPVAISLTVNASQFVHTYSGVLAADTDIVISADNDAESLEMADDGSITEGSENGEVIEVTLTGGTFAQTLSSASWVAANMPQGVTVGAVNRISSTLVRLVLSGNTSEDYDSDITGFQLTIPDGDVNEYVGADFVLTSGVTFSAIDESMQISMSDGGSGIEEAAENGHVITVTINERVFASTLNPASWSLLNLPVGVTLGGVNRESDTEVSLVLSGNRTQDYDSNISNAELRIQVGQIVDVSTQVIVNTGVVFNANDDDETITIALDGDGIAEGSEHGEVINATLTGGTFPNPLTTGNWTLNNLPDGVSIGSVTRTGMTSASITLSGNRTIDFDSDITTIDLAVAGDDVDDFGSASLSSDNAVTINAVADGEEIALSGGPFVEGSEDGGVITATLTGGTFTTVTISDVMLSNLPVGVSLGSLNQINNTELQLTLSGNATDDYDADITNATLTVDATVIDETATDVAGTGVTFQAVVEPVVLVLSDNGDLYESEEDAKVLTIKVREDIFTSSIDPAGFVFSGLPGGVEAGSVVRTNDTTVTVTLAGNRTTDYDTDILDAGVEIADAEFQNSTSALSSYTGWQFIATDDGEFVSFSTTATINEGAEDGTEINIAVSGGTLAAALDPAEWTFTGLPGGVSVGLINRVDELNATITLSGNASADYDVDIVVDELIVSGTQIDDFVGATLTGSGSITFNATVESQDLLLTSLDALDETNLDGAQLSIKLIGATFNSPLEMADLTLNNHPVGLTISGVTEVSGDSAVIDLAFDGTDFDVDYPNFNVTLLTSGSSLGLAVNSNVTAITAIVEPGEMIISHAGLTEENLDGAIVDIVMVEDEFADATLDLSNFYMSNAPIGASISAVTYSTPTSATFEITFDGTDFDFDVTNMTLGMASSEALSGNAYASNMLAISATDDIETISFTNAHDVLEGTEDGQIFTVELAGGTFVNPLNGIGWSFTYLPQGVLVGDVVLIDPTHAEVYLSGNTSVDFDQNETSAIIVDASQYRDATGEIQTTNSFTFVAVVETLTTAVDTIPEADINTVNIPFVLEDDFLTNLTPDLGDFVLQNAPAGLEIESVNVIDENNFELSLNYTGAALTQDESFSLMVTDNILHGLESLVSNDIVIDSEVGISGLSDGIQMYLNGENLVLKQTGTVKKGIITMYETNGRKAADFRVEAKTVNIFQPLLKENVYLIQFTSDDGKQYLIKGFLNK